MAGATSSCIRESFVACRGCVVTRNARNVYEKRPQTLKAPRTLSNWAFFNFQKRKRSSQWALRGQTKARPASLAVVALITKNARTVWDTTATGKNSQDVPFQSKNSKRFLHLSILMSPFRKKYWKNSKMAATGSKMLSKLQAYYAYNKIE